MWGVGRWRSFQVEGSHRNTVSKPEGDPAYQWRVTPQLVERFASLADFRFAVDSGLIIYSGAISLSSYPWFPKSQINSSSTDVA